MKTLLLLFLSATAASAVFAARVEQITLDLERPKQAFALQLTESADTTLRAALRASGVEFEPSGWTGLLWYGDKTGGITLTNSTSSFGSMEWAIPAASVPTNGRYSVQILGASGSVVEEWGAGVMSVRASPSGGALPAEWLAGNPAWITATNALAVAQSAATTQQLADAVAPLAGTQSVAEVAGDLAEHTGDTANPHGVTAPQIGALTDEQDLIALGALYGTNALLRAAFTNEAVLREAGDTALSTGKLDVAATATWETGSHDGLLTNEQDLAALRTYHYGSPDIRESPADWFEFADGVITGFTYTNGRENVVIPWAIGGEDVTAIGAYAFSDPFSFDGVPVVSVIAPRTVRDIRLRAFFNCLSLATISMLQAEAVGEFAFYYCGSLSSVSLPQAMSVGSSAFYGCTKLASVSIAQNAPVQEESVFGECTNVVIVTNPHATGWSDEWNGRPVVRPALHADAVYQDGDLVATMGDVAQAVAGKVDAQNGTATNLNVVSEWQTLADVTGSVTLTNLAERPIQCAGTGAVTLAFSGLRSPQPVYLTLAGFDSVAWPTNAYAVGGWGAWQTNRVNHFAVWQVADEIYVNQITTSEE